MPVYNGEKYLAEAIESILTQTYDNFEFLIVDDGSTDKSLEIINSYSNKDPRIRVLRNPRNLSIAVSLNRGIDAARGKYIARMDCDDVSLPARLEKQVLFLDKNPEIGVLGCRVRNIDSQGSFISEPKRPLTHSCNLWLSLFKPPVMHPSVMYRKDVAIEAGGYNKSYIPAADYEFWSRMIKITKFSQLDETLVILRSHGTNVGSIHRDAQMAMSAKISSKNIRSLANKEGSISNPDDIGRFVWRRSGVVSNSLVYSSIFLIYFNFLAENNLTRVEKEWIKENLLSLITPLFGLPFGKQMCIVLGVVFNSRIKMWNKIVVFGSFARTYLNFSRNWTHNAFGSKLE